MFDIKREYVVTERDKKAVLIDIETFEKIEEILEGHGPGKYMEEIEGEETLSLGEAGTYYSSLKKD